MLFFSLLLICLHQLLECFQEDSEERRAFHTDTNEEAAYYFTSTNLLYYKHQFIPPTLAIQQAYSEVLLLKILTQVSLTTVT